MATLNQLIINTDTTAWRLANNKERARAWRQARASRQRHHNWVRTPNRVWKTFQRDENHKWRRWHGARASGAWEYGSDRDIAHAHIRSEFTPAITQERAHD